jgi:hypothetical protein
MQPKLGYLDVHPGQGRFIGPTHYRRALGASNGERSIFPAGVPELQDRRRSDQSCLESGQRHMISLLKNGQIFHRSTVPNA